MPRRLLSRMRRLCSAIISVMVDEHGTRELWEQMCVSNLKNDHCIDYNAVVSEDYPSNYFSMIDNLGVKDFAKKAGLD